MDIKFIAHRGAAGNDLAENTPEAIQRALQAGSFIAVEIDVWWNQTSSSFVVSHDQPSVDKEQYQLKQALELLNEQKVYIDLKDSKLTKQQTTHLAKLANLNDVMFLSEHVKILTKLAKELPIEKLAFISKWSNFLKTKQCLKSLQITHLVLNKWLALAMFWRIRSWNIEVTAIYTVNRRSILRLLKALGFSVFITDSIELSQS